MSELTIEPQLPRSAQANTNRISMGRIAGFGLLAIVLSVIANFIVLTLVVNLLGLPEFGAMSPVMVVALTAIGVLLATLVFAIVSRTAKNPIRVFSIIAVIALLLSFVPNILTLTGAGNVMRSLGIGGGTGARGQRTGQQQDGAPAGADAQAGANSGANANGQADAQQAGQGQGQGRRTGQNFGALRVPMQLSLMAMHGVAFAISLIVLTKAAASSRIAHKAE